MSWMTTARCPFFEKRFTFPWRLLFYLLPWLGATAVFFIGLFPEAYPAQTDDSPLVQALKLPFLTPLMVIGGFGYGIFGEDGGLFAGLLIALIFLVHAGFALSRRGVATLISLCGLQVLLVAIGTVAFFYLIDIPEGT